MKYIFTKLASLFHQTPKSDDLQSICFDEYFLSLSINKDFSHKINMNRTLQLIDTLGSIKQFTIFKKNKEILYNSFNKGKLINYRHQEDSAINEIFIHKMAESVQFPIEKAKELLNSSSEVISDITSETRGLEWIKASLIVLKSAIKQSIKDSELLFTGQIFSGRRKQSENFQIRIQCLSLDFLLEFLKDGRLRVLAWDYKSSRPDSSTQATFKGDFVDLKQPVFDEFILLLIQICKAATKIN